MSSFTCSCYQQYRQFMISANHLEINIFFNVSRYNWTTKIYALLYLFIAYIDSSYYTGKMRHLYLVTCSLIYKSRSHSIEFKSLRHSHLNIYIWPFKCNIIHTAKWQNASTVDRLATIQDHILCCNTEMSHNQIADSWQYIVSILQSFQFWSVHSEVLLNVIKRECLID